MQNVKHVSSLKSGLVSLEKFVNPGPMEVPRGFATDAKRSNIYPKPSTNNIQSHTNFALHTVLVI